MARDYSQTGCHPSDTIVLEAEHLKGLEQWRFQTAVICPGSWNMPLIQYFAERTRTIPVADERSAGFFAAGMASDEWIAVVVTSGTAVAELFPAIIEAHYRRLKIVVISADRPRSLSFTGAPQTIPQDRIFGSFATSWNPGMAVPHHGPVHWNLHLGAESSRTLAGPGALEHLAIVVGPLEPEAARPLQISQSISSKIAVVCEALSNVSCYRSVHDPEGWWHNTAVHHRLHLVRVGGVPTWSFWRHLSSHPALRVSIFDPHGWPGTDVPIHQMNWSLPSNESLDQLLISAPGAPSLIPTQDQPQDPPNQEAKVIQRMSSLVPEGSLVFLGNSLPIRYWNRWGLHRPDCVFCGHRGANGIDGLIAGFAGKLEAGPANRPGFLIIGDLGAWYDLNSLSLLSRYPSAVMIVMNNQGGRIFDRIGGPSPFSGSAFSGGPSPLSAEDRSRLLRQAQPINWEHAARAFNISFERWSSLDHCQAFSPSPSGPKIIEVVCP